VNNEEHLTGTDQPELFACDGLHGGRIFLQAPHLFTKPRVLLTLGGEGRGDFRVLPAGSNRLQEPLVAHEGIDDQNHGNQRKNVIEEAVP